MGIFSGIFIVQFDSNVKMDTETIYTPKTKKLHNCCIRILLKINDKQERILLEVLVDPSEQSV
jgi:hypothetical protein